MKPTGALAEIIGHDPVSRLDVPKKVWEYIKKNGLQDANNRQMINPDAKLGRVFGSTEPINMFKINKPINQHLEEA